MLNYHLIQWSKNQKHILSLQYYNCNFFIDIDECSDEQACGLHSTCVNIDGGYYCVCQQGYTKGGNDCVGKLQI